MDHQEAVRIQAVERYLLDEMSPTERDAFEEHYFSCVECAEELRLSAAVVDNIAALAGEQPRLLKNRKMANAAAWLRRSWAMAAVVLLGAVIATQNLYVIPHLRKQASGNAPQALTTLSLAAADARGGQNPGETPAAAVTMRGDEPLGLYVDIPPEPRYPAYTLRVVNERGGALFSVQVPAEQANETVQIYVPAGLLKATRYTLVVLGDRAPAAPASSEDELARHSFVVRN